MLLEKIPDIQFIHPPAWNQFERVCSSYVQNKTVEKSFKNTYDSYQNIFQAVQIAWEEILAEEK